ncbi:MAG: tetratricopeptide repeat protein [Candidatus Gastranaerophilales bacterium]|nr:tetratricopeptide repeat protein [Candidatus Gastranaerophilales bacterium]
MKKIAVLLFMICCVALNSFAGELTIGTPAANPTEEIDTFFSENGKINWFVHRLKRTDKNKVTNPKKDETITKTNEPESRPKKENVKANKNIQPTQSVKKEEKVISKTENAEKTKEEIAKEKQEEQRRKYRELEELTELNQQAIALYTDNNLDESLACFSKIPEKMRTPEIWLLMGNILMDKGKKDEAAFMYGRAILTDATFYKAYYNLGNIYLADDKFNMAIEQFKLAVKYNINNPYTHYNLGCAYLRAGELKKAKYSFIKAVELKNTVPDFHYNLAYVYKKLGKEKQAKVYLENYNKLTGQG